MRILIYLHNNALMSDYKLLMIGFDFKTVLPQEIYTFGHDFT